jgi:hypothetical protein
MSDLAIRPAEDPPAVMDEAVLLKQVVLNPVRHDICARVFHRKPLNFLRIALALGIAFAHS